jgi:sec-independent protein translocase protein TatA
MLPNIGAPELIIILVIALLILGPGKLPEVGSSLGKSIREFRKASTDIQESVKVDVDTSPLPATPAPSATAPAAPAAAVAAAVAAQPAESPPATPTATAPASDSSTVAS